MFTWKKLIGWLTAFRATSTAVSLGQRGKNAAVRYLKGKRFLIVDRNVRFHNGEIDIVAVEGRTIVFVEVKTRSSDRKGDPWEAVDRIKQKKIRSAASLYLRRESLDDQRSRFDIVSVLWPGNQKRPLIEHLVDAFDDSGV